METIGAVDVSARTQYALRALVCLTLRGGDRAVSGADIASLGGIPRKYVEQVMHDLRQAGLVSSQRGKRGGYSLACDPHAVTVLNVLETIEGSLDGFGRMPGGDLVRPPLEAVWRDAVAALRQCLGAATIAGLADRIAVHTYQI